MVCVWKCGRVVGMLCVRVCVCVCMCVSHGVGSSSVCGWMGLFVLI